MWCVCRCDSSLSWPAHLTVETKKKTVKTYRHDDAMEKLDFNVTNYFITVKKSLWISSSSSQSQHDMLVVVYRTSTQRKHDFSSQAAAMCCVFFFMQLLSVDCACWTWDWELRKLVSKSDNNKILYFKLLPSLARLTLHIFLAPDETTTRSTHQHYETSYERKIFARPQTTRESALLRADLRCSFFGDDQKCRKESIDRRARRRGGRQRRAI